MADNPPAAAGSYIGRHWRGELSLFVSYIINGIGLSLAAYGATKLLYRADVASAPRFWLLAIAAWTVFVVLLGVWQLVGAWRSATRRIAALRLEKRQAVLAHLARGMVALGAASLSVQVVRNIGPGTFANLQIVFGSEALAPHTLRISDDGATIVLSGGIGAGVAAEFSALLAASPGVRRAEVTSNGGRVAEALQVEALIRARGLETYASGFCASACTIIYMGGRERLLGPAGRLGFHRYAFPGLTFEQEALLNDKGKATLIDAGVSPDFVARAFETPAEAVWIPDQAALLAARVATRLHKD